MLRVKPKLPFLRVKDIEAKADELLKHYTDQMGIMIKFPLEMDFIIQNLINFSIDWQPDEHSMLAFIDPNERVVCFNSTRTDFFDIVGAFEFTAAHEVGHFVLNHFEEVSTQALPSLILEPDRFLSRENYVDAKYKQHEFQANYFAGSLLMPRENLLSETKNCDLMQWKTLYSLAERFRVSPSAMVKRLEDLNLIHVKDKKIYKSKKHANGQSTFL